MEMLGHKVYDVQTVVRERHQQLMYDLFGRMGALKGRFPTANQTHGGPERERALDALYDAILETGSTAVFDNPFPVITEELLQRSPNAKVSLLFLVGNLRRGSLSYLTLTTTAELGGRVVEPGSIAQHAP